MSTSREWSLNDKRFLRSLRIVADAPAPPSPRFVVEPGTVDGEYHVVDRLKRFNDYIVNKSYKDPKAAANEYARQMNAKHAEKHQDDSA